MRYGIIAPANMLLSEVVTHQSDLEYKTYIMTPQSFPVRLPSHTHGTHTYHAHVSHKLVHPAAHTWMATLLTFHIVSPVASYWYQYMPATIPLWLLFIEGEKRSETNLIKVGRICWSRLLPYVYDTFIHHASSPIPPCFLLYSHA